MNLWYTVANLIYLDELGDEENHFDFEFQQFETKEEAKNNLVKIRAKFKACPIVATVEWPKEFWKKFYEEKKPLYSVKISN